MSNSQNKDPLPLGNKQLNIPNQLTPKKNQSVLSQVSNHSKQKSISFQNSSSGSVSYAQLQIILQNVQKVKKKANQQMSSLQKKNAKLQQQNSRAKDQLRRYENLQETIRQQKIGVQMKYQAQLNSTKQQLKSAQSANKTLSDMILHLKQQIRQKNYQICTLKQTIQRNKLESQHTRAKYQKLIDVLKINQTSSQYRFIKQYEGIPNLLQQYQRVKSDLQHQTSTVQEYKNTIEQLKEQLAGNNRVINTITQQNNHLFKVVQQLNQQKQVLSNEISTLQNQKSQVVRQKDQTLIQIEDEITTMKKQADEQLQQKQQIISKLREQYNTLQTKWIQCVDREKILKQENHFKAVVEDVCNQFQDYENVIKRIKYLEKYRSQYYFNVEKIQHLCKLLDS